MKELRSTAIMLVPPGPPAPRYSLALRAPLLFFGVAVDIRMRQVQAALALMDVEENRLRSHD